MSHEQGKETVTQPTKGASETILAAPSPHDMSRSPTVHSEGTIGETKGDVQQVLAKDDDELPSESTLGVVEKKLEAEGKLPHVPHHNALASLPSSRKSILLFCFCLSMVSLMLRLRSTSFTPLCRGYITVHALIKQFIDAAGVSATFLMTSESVFPNLLSLATHASPHFRRPQRQGGRPSVDPGNVQYGLCGYAVVRRPARGSLPSSPSISRRFRRHRSLLLDHLVSLPHRLPLLAPLTIGS
jgi:hypothetical protein